MTEYSFAMAEHYKSCSEFISRGNETSPVFMFDEDYERIKKWVLKYPNLETGGDLFGLWTSDPDDLTPLVHIVLGPGEGCRRTEYSFFQDVPYLKQAGNAITDSLLGHIGEWHSHHSLSLFEPSMGDYNTVRRNYPRGFHGFLLIIANILPSNVVSLSPYLFRETGKVEKGKVVLLAGESPFRRHSQIKQAVERGAERSTNAMQPGERLNRARNKVAQVGNPAQIKEREARPKYPIKSSQPATNSSSQERSKRETTRAVDATTKANQPAQPDERPLPPKPQWYAGDDGAEKRQKVRLSFDRLEPGNVEEHLDPENNVYFEFKRKNCLLVVRLPSTYPRGRIVLERWSGGQKKTTVKEIEGTGTNTIMTEIIKCIQSN